MVPDTQPEILELLREDQHEFAAEIAIRGGRGTGDGAFEIAYTIVARSDGSRMTGADFYELGDPRAGPRTG
jgi:hypothetical protein